MDFPVRALRGDEHPPLLAHIPEPPKTLYLRGALPDSASPLLAVVGSRAASRYGKDACEHLLSGLAGSGVTIVSGLALGIDALAHRAALRAGLRALAVPGSGLADAALYPRTNVPLAHDILAAGGGLLSEYEPTHRAAPWTFPRRNRLMAGMCHATLVIEASAKSGTLITARLAAEYGRELLCVPHPIFAELGAGPHLFIRIGATLVRTADDILEALGREPASSGAPDPARLPPLHAALFALLSEARERDELFRLAGGSIAEAQIALMDLELSGYIVERGGLWQKV